MISELDNIKNCKHFSNNFGNMNPDGNNLSLFSLKKKKESQFTNSGYCVEHKYMTMYHTFIHKN